VAAPDLGHKTYERLERVEIEKRKPVEIETGSLGMRGVRGTGRKRPA
jgi:hypothetical protein